MDDNMDIVTNLILELFELYPDRDSQRKRLVDMVASDMNNPIKDKLNEYKKTHGEKYPKQKLAEELHICESTLVKAIYNVADKRYLDNSTLYQLESLCGIDKGTLVFPAPKDILAEYLLKNIDDYDGDVGLVDVTDEEEQSIAFFINETWEQFQTWDLLKCFRCVSEIDILLLTPAQCWGRLRKYFLLPKEYQELINHYLDIRKKDITETIKTINFDNDIKILIESLWQLYHEDDKTVKKHLKNWKQSVKVKDVDDTIYKKILLFIFYSMLLRHVGYFVLFDLYVDLINSDFRQPYLLILELLANQVLGKNDEILDVIINKNNF